MARVLSDRVDKIGKTRATVLARTEVINAHAEGTLKRFEELGVGEVTVKAEWQAAGDNRVCPICENLEGTTHSLEDVRSATARLTEDDVRPHLPEPKRVDQFDVSSLTGEFPVKPPAHPQCRCAIVPA
jgi:SPP1 gp7 family putative phage head morphogenesis protein